MPDCFEITHKDLAGRIGRLTTPHGTAETPLLMPVVNPHLLMLPAPQLQEAGAEMLITNSYIISQDEDLRATAQEKGLHHLLDFSGPIMTDSGAFQLSVYGSIDVEPLEILRFQQSIRSDVCVPLDIPTPPDVPLSRAEQELQETIRRLEEAAGCRDDLLLAGPVQGSTYPHLREEAGRRLSKMPFDIYPVGGVVPLMESYRFSDLVEVVAAAKRGLGPGVPVHLFGAGHPMVFALAAALGCDLFDSAAYALYARDGRYLTASGTWKLEDLEYLPCHCPVCQKNDPQTLRESPERTKLLARHNLEASFSEIRLIKQHIWEGSLWEHLEGRCRSHPRMYEAFRRLTDHAGWMERLDRSSKSTFFCLSPQSARRPEVLRYGMRLGRLGLTGRVLVTDQRIDRDQRDLYDHVMTFKPPFGPIPAALSETYPLQAEVPKEPDAESMHMALKNLQLLEQSCPDAQFIKEIGGQDPKKGERSESQASGRNREVGT